MDLSRLDNPIENYNFVLHRIIETPGGQKTVRLQNPWAMERKNLAKKDLDYIETISMKLGTMDLNSIDRKDLSNIFRTTRMFPKLEEGELEMIKRNANIDPSVFNVSELLKAIYIDFRDYLNELLDLEQSDGSPVFSVDAEEAAIFYWLTGDGQDIKQRKKQRKKDEIQRILQESGLFGKPIDPSVPYTEFMFFIQASYMDNAYFSVRYLIETYLFKGNSWNRIR
jgi:hypothetical protein